MLLLLYHFLCMLDLTFVFEILLIQNQGKICIIFLKLHMKLKGFCEKPKDAAHYDFLVLTKNIVHR